MSYRQKYAPYVDFLGNISDNIYITGNPHLFNGEVVLLEKLAGKETDLSVHAIDYAKRCRVYPGLYSRYPNSKQTGSHDNISHDEYNGLMFLSLVNPQIAEDIADYGSQYGWQYIEKPKSNYFRTLWRSPIKTIKKTRAFFEDIEANPQNDSAVDWRHDPNIAAIRYWRQPRDVCFYKLMADRSTWMFERLYLAAATINSSFSGFAYAKGGTMVMAWCRWQCLKLAGKDTGIVALGNWLFDLNMKRKYGKNYVRLVFKTYFPEDHPTNKLLAQIKS